MSAKALCVGKLFLRKKGTTSGKVERQLAVIVGRGRGKAIEEDLRCKMDKKWVCCAGREFKDERTHSLSFETAKEVKGGGCLGGDF